MKITLTIIGIILSLGSFIFGIFEVPKRIKEFRLTGKVDYNNKTGSCAMYPEGRIILYCIYTGLSLFALGCFILSLLY